MKKKILFIFIVFGFLVFFVSFNRKSLVCAATQCGGSGSDSHTWSTCHYNSSTGENECLPQTFFYNWSCGWHSDPKGDTYCSGPDHASSRDCTIKADGSCTTVGGENHNLPSSGCYTYDPAIPTNIPGGPTPTDDPSGCSPRCVDCLHGCGTDGCCLTGPIGPPGLTYATLLAFYVDNNDDANWDRGEQWVLPSTLVETKVIGGAESTQTCNLNAGCTGITGRTLSNNGTGMAGFTLTTHFPGPFDPWGHDYNTGGSIEFTAVSVNTSIWNNPYIISYGNNKFDRNGDCRGNDCGPHHDQDCTSDCWEHSPLLAWDRFGAGNHPWDYVGRPNMCVAPSISISLPYKNMLGTINPDYYDDIFTPLNWPAGCTTGSHPFVCNGNGRGLCFGERTQGQVKVPFILFDRAGSGDWMDMDIATQEFILSLPAGFSTRYPTYRYMGQDGKMQFIAIGIKPDPLQCSVNPNLATGFTRITDISGRKAYQYTSNGSPGTIGVAGYQNGNPISSKLGIYYTKINTQAWGTPASTPALFVPQQNFYGAKIVNDGYSGSKAAEITLGSSEGTWGRIGSIYQGRFAAETPSLNTPANFAGKTMVYGGCYKTSPGAKLQFQLAVKEKDQVINTYYDGITNLQSPDWTCTYKSIDIPDDAEILDLSAMAVGINPVGGGEKVLVDNLSIIYFDGGPNLLTNADFETGGVLTPWRTWDGAGPPSSIFGTDFDPSGLLAGDYGDYDVVCNNTLPSSSASRCSGNPDTVAAAAAGWQDCGANSRIVVRVGPPSVIGQINVTFFNGKSLSDCTPGGAGSLSGTATVNTVAQTYCTVPPATTCSKTQSGIDVATGGTINNLYVNPTPANNTRYLTSLTAPLPANWIQCDPRTGGKSTDLNSVTTTGNVLFGITQNVGSWYQTLGGNVHGQTGNQTWSTPKSVVPPNPLNFFNISDPTRSIGLVSAHGTITCSDSMGGADTSCHNGATDWRSATDYSITSDETSNPTTYEDFDGLFTTKSDGFSPITPGNIDAKYPTSDTYFVSDGLTFQGGDFTIDKKLIIFVDGDVNITKNIYLGANGFLAIFANGSITVDDPSVTSIAGIFLSTNEFTATGSNDTTPLTVNGTVIAGGVSNNRDFGSNPALSQSKATVQFAFNPLLIVNMPESLKHDASFSWKEVTR